MTALSRAGSGGCAAQPTLALLMASLKRSPPWKRASTNHPFPLWLRSTTVHDGSSDPDLGLRGPSGHLQHFPQPRDELFDAYRGPGQRLHPIDDLVEAGERIAWYAHSIGAPLEDGRQPLGDSPVIGSHADALAASAGCDRHRPVIREHDPEHEEVTIDDLGCDCHRIPPFASRSRP